MSDPAALAAGFDALLRGRGVRAGTRRAATFAEVLRVLPPATTDALYWRARAAMLPDIDDLATFDDAFAAFFGRRDHEAMRELVERVEPPARPPDAPQRESLPPPPSERPAAAADAERAPTQWVAASLERSLRDRDFDDLDDDERAAMLRLIAQARVAAEVRRSRRRRADRHGDRFDFRATLRGAARTAGELVRRRTTRRRERLRPLVFLLDVSGSMEPFARALLQYAQVTALARPRVRTFAFATELTELTAGSAVGDYGGGTRIGAALRTFNDDFAQRGAARGGTVVILSDGWERDDPALVASEIARLRRLTRRLVWVNPHKRHPAYEPLARGMAAALPYLDAFVSGHTLRSLDEVAAAIEGSNR